MYCVEESTCDICWDFSALLINSEPRHFAPLAPAFCPPCTRSVFPCSLCISSSISSTWRVIALRSIELSFFKHAFTLGTQETVRCKCIEACLIFATSVYFLPEDLFCSNLNCFPVDIFCHLPNRRHFFESVIKMNMNFNNPLEIIITRQGGTPGSGGIEPWPFKKGVTWAEAPFITV